MNKKMKKILAMILCTAFLACSACQKTPDTEYVTNKEGQENLISDNAGYDNGIPVREQCNAPTHAEASGETLNDFTTIEVDADVYVPEQTSVPIYTLALKDITEDNVADIVKTIFPTGEYYNPDYTIRIGAGYTTEELYENIETLQNWINNVEPGNVEKPVFDEGTGELLEANQEYIERMQSWIEDYEEQLAYAEEGPYYGDGVSYEYQPQTDEIYLSEEKSMDYEYETILFRGKTGRTGREEAQLLIARDGTNEEIHYRVRSIMQCGYTLGQISLSDANKNDLEENSCVYSREEAIAMAEEFITSLGIENMSVHRAADTELSVGLENGQQISYGRSGYRLYLYPTYGDMNDIYLDSDFTIFNSMNTDTAGIPSMVSGSIMDKYEDSEDMATEGYETPYYREMAVVTIMDDGIVDAFVLNPQEEQEQLAENVALIDFDSVLEQGITQLENVYAEAGKPGVRCDIEVNRIVMNYAIMQAPNNQNEWTLIPVWDFKAGEFGTTYVTINAIDGTVFDRESGY